MTNFIDLHCDTLMQAYKKNLQDIYDIKDTMLDIKRMKKNKCLAEFFAIFMPPKNSSFDDFDRPDDKEYFNYLYDVFNTTIENYPEEFSLALNYDDLVKNIDDKKISGFLTFEDGRMIDSFEKLDYFYKKGIRLITLTWNEANSFGYPNSKDKNLMEKGLTAFGKEAIQQMNELGILIDVSHLSDGGFWDVKEISKKPFIASHSNSRELSPHQRNLTDDMIRAISESGGVAGINFCASFLNPSCENSSSIQMKVDHIKHMINKGGIEVVALGSDFDGIAPYNEINNINKIDLLFNELKKAGLSENDIDKIAKDNAMRVIKDSL